MPNLILLLTLLVLAVNLLTACAEGNSNYSACPPIVDYSEDFQDKLADEIENAPEDAKFPKTLIDYLLLRDQIRICNKNKHF